MFKRIGILLVVLAALVTATVLAPNFTFTIGSVPASSQLDVKARDLTLVCPGALYKAGGASGATLGNFAHVGNVGYLSNFNASNGSTVQNTDGVFAVTDPSGKEQQGSVLLNASQLQAAAGATLNGLAGTNCFAPTNEAWLVGGDTTTGRESLLILRNATSVDSTVDLEIFSEAGKVDAPGLSGVAVVAGKTTVLPLAGIIPNTRAFTTHVLARGGAVSSWIQQRTVRGLSAAGVDYVYASPDASTSQVIPGIFVRGSKQAAKLIAANKNYSDLQNVLRVFVPGEKDATITAQIMGAGGDGFGTVIRQTVKAGSTIDLPIASLNDGNYVALIDSDVKIRSAIRLSRVTTTSAPDFTWLAAAEGFTGKRNITIPSAGISKLCIFNKKTNASSVVSVTPGSTYSFNATDGEIFATLIVDINGTITNLAVLDQKNAGGKVAVSVR